MKVATVLLFVVGYVCGNPEFGTDGKYEPAQDVQAQQFESDSASLPYMLPTPGPLKANVDRNMYFEGAMIPVELVYEPHAGESETQAVVKRVSLETLTGSTGPPKKILNRVERSHEFPDGMALDNDIPNGNYEKAADSPTMEMYNDNFGGEHDSQEGTVPEDTLRNQLLRFDPDAYNRALGIEARAPASKSDVRATYPNQLSQMSLPDRKVNSGNGIVRTIQHYQTIVAPTPMFRSDLMKTTIPYEHVQVPRFLWSFFPTQIRSNTHESNLFPDNIFQQRHRSDSFPQANTYPRNGVWSAYTSIVEYQPRDDLSQRGNIRQKRDTASHGKKKKRVQPKPEEEQVFQQQDKDPGYQEFFVEDLSRTPGSTGPKILTLKVRRGGVAIAGPGGIATAGSGGTAIVGPGGTAYTTQDGTAVVGPGGRVIQIPSDFQTTKIEARNNDPHNIFIPPGGKILAEGPFVYYGRNHQSSLPIAPIIERL